MSKQSEAKSAQGYEPKPIQKICSNCKHFQRNVESYTGYFGGEYSIEKNLRCGIGGFAVKKTATCNLFEMEIKQ